MKRSSLFTPALALAFGLCATGALAERATPVSENFQGAAFNNGNTNTVAGITANNLTWADPDGNTAVESGVLKVDATTDDPTTAAIASDAKTKFDSAVTGNKTASFTADVAFTPSKTILGSSDIADGGDLKFALFAYDDGTSTNLYYYTSGTAASTGIEVTENALHALVVNFSDDNGTRKFSVSYNGSDAAGPYPFANNDQVGQVEFAGNGSVDNIVFSYDLAPVNLSWPTSVSVASYTINGNAGDALTAGDGSKTVYGDVGDVIVLTIQNADGVTKTFTGTVGTDATIGNSDYAYTWADYLGDAVNGAYEIDNLAELKLFQKGVATNTASAKASQLATAGLTFKLMDDITLTEAWPGIGVQNGKDIYSTADFNAAAFQGTFDGQNHTISGFQMIGKGDNPEGLDYCGFFNSTYDATIQNLKIAYAGSLFAADTTASTKESGATFVGVAKNSTLQNLTSLQKDVSTAVSCSKGFGGIVGYLTSGTTVDSCTNNVNMTSLANNKCGGIAMIAQNGAAVTIRNCQNNGTQTTGSSNSEYGAIVGYVGLDITIANCETTVGRFLKHHDHTVTLQGVNKGDATVLAYQGAATPGLNFATVDNGVATFVADNALALNGAYKVMGPSATATFAFAEAGSISFDTNLIQNVTFNITAADGSGLTVGDPEDVSGVLTFTAAVVPSYSAGETPVEGEGGSSYRISAEEATYLNTLVGTKGADAVETALDTISAEDFSAAVLLNQDITEGNPGSYSFDITKISKSGSTVTVTASLVRKGTVIGAINGTATLYSASTPALLESAPTKQSQTFSLPNAEKDAPATASVTFTGADKFFKVVIE